MQYENEKVPCIKGTQIAVWIGHLSAETAYEASQLVQFRFGSSVFLDVGFLNRLRVCKRFRRYRL
jgi:hypothetical protein